MNYRIVKKQLLLYTLLLVSAVSYGQEEPAANSAPGTKEIYINGVAIDKAAIATIVRRRLMTLQDGLAMMSTLESRLKQEEIIKNVLMPLFYNDTNIMVTIQNKGREPTKCRIHRYFKRLEGLAFSNVEVKDCEFMYLTDIYKAPDGGYYSTRVYIRYDFKTGSINELSRKRLTAVDLSKEEEGGTHRRFSLYLGDITVTENRD